MFSNLKAIFIRNDLNNTDSHLKHQQQLARQVLEELNASSKLLEHVTQVTEISKKISTLIEQNGIPVSIEDVINGAMLHDIGKTRVKGIRHGLAGAEIAKGLNYSTLVQNIIAHHVLGGLSKEIILDSKLHKSPHNLPARDLLPVSVEEKIVAFADQLVHQRSISRKFLKADKSQDLYVQGNLFKLYEEILALCFM